MCSFGILSAIILYLYYMGWIYESEGFMMLAYMAVVLFLLAFLFLIYRRYTRKGNIDVPINISEEGKNTLVTAFSESVCGFFPIPYTVKGQKMQIVVPEDFTVIVQLFSVLFKVVFVKIVKRGLICDLPYFFLQPPPFSLKGFYFIHWTFTFFIVP